MLCLKEKLYDKAKTYYKAFLICTMIVCVYSFKFHIKFSLFFIVEQIILI